MNCRWVCFCIMVSVTAQSALRGADTITSRTAKLLEQTRQTLREESEAPFNREQLHALIREVAAKIEEKFKGVHPEADGLVQRVEETLAAPEPAKANEEDRQLMLAKEMVPMNGAAGFKAHTGGVRGPVFDNSDTGYMQRYQDLESASTRDAEEVWRWLEMAEAAQKLKWKDKEEMCTQRALGAARALVSREPKNAEAHALLGLALEWSSEKLTALQTALKLDPKQPLAMYELLERRILQAWETATLRHETRLDEKVKAWQEMDRALFDRPLAEEEALAFERQQEELNPELMQLLVLSHERNDLAVYLKTVNLLRGLRQLHDEVVLAAKRGPDESFEMFQVKLAMMKLNSGFTLLADDSQLKTALELAADDPEATGTIILQALIGDSMKALQDKQRPKEPRMELIRNTFAKLLEMAGADESLRAARACEGVGIMEMGLMMVLQREPIHLELLLRAVHLDPFRQRTQHMLMGLCINMPRKSNILTAAAALTQIELALLPGLQTRRMCATTAAMLGDWPAAYRLMDACLREKPDDLGLLNQKAVLILRENQSKAAQTKAAIYFHKIESLREKPDTKSDKEDLKLIARNLFLMLGGKNDASRKELAVAQRDKLLDENECQELEKLLP
jgi:hypothetical protein